jgi:Glyoxalase-like domain
VRLDHLILAVADLPAAAAALGEATGLAALPGGAHPDWGTINMVVPLGGAYLELVAVADTARAERSAFGRRVAAGAATGDPMALVGWAVEPDDLDATAARLGLHQQRGRRERADGGGGTLSWAMAGVEEALSRGLPFFLRWDDAASNPARAEAPHRVAPAGVAWIEVGGDRAALDAWLGDEAGDLDVRASAPGAAPRAAIALRGGDRLVI